ncbi:MAG: hypothetical protein WBX15_03730 [Thermoanaerobaculia bacterium]
MIIGVTFPLAAIVVMLWILWSDSIRPRKPSRILYFVRVVLYLVTSGVLLYNMIEYSPQYSGGARSVTIFAAVVGVGGAAYFLRQALLRRPKI